MYLKSLAYFSGNLFTDNQGTKTAIILSIDSVIILAPTIEVQYFCPAAKKTATTTSTPEPLTPPATNVLIIELTKAAVTANKTPVPNTGKGFLSHPL